MKSLRIRLTARLDLRQAVAWYESQSTGSGEALEVRVLELFKLIAAMPAAFPEVGKTVRRAVVSDFPYLIFYRELPDAIVIYAIIHARRDPRYIDRRLQSEAKRQDIDP